MQIAISDECRLIGRLLLAIVVHSHQLHACCNKCVCLCVGRFVWVAKVRLSCIPAFNIIREVPYNYMSIFWRNFYLDQTYMLFWLKQWQVAQKYAMHHLVMKWFILFCWTTIYVSHCNNIWIVWANCNTIIFHQCADELVVNFT